MGDSRDGFTCNEDGTNRGTVKPKEKTQVTYITNDIKVTLQLTPKNLAKAIVHGSKPYSKKLRKQLKKALKDK